MLIEIYVYNKTSGEFKYKDVGQPNDVIADLGDDKDFTLTPPPDNTKTWRWVDSHWE